MNLSCTPATTQPRALLRSEATTASLTISCRQEFRVLHRTDLHSRLQEEQAEAQAVLSAGRLRRQLYAALSAIYEILSEESGGTEAELRRGSIAALSGALAAWRAGALKIDDSGSFYLSQSARLGVLRQLLELCPVPAVKILRGLPAAGRAALLEVLVYSQAIPFQQSIEILWPASMHFVPRAPDATSAVYRKAQGAYMTPGWLARRTVQYALTAYLRGKGVADHDLKRLADGKGRRLPRATRKRLGALLRDVRLVDAACGVGSFLYQSFHLILSWRISLSGRPRVVDYVRRLLSDQLHGVDRDPLAVALTKVTLWLEASRYIDQSAPAPQIRCGDALTGRPFHGTWDSDLNSLPLSFTPDGLDWATAFPRVAREGGFSVAVGNPPWERVKLLSREFFEVTEPSIAAAPTTAARRRRMGQLARAEFELKRAEHAAYAQGIRDSGYFRYTASGDLNLYPLFIERALQLVNCEGAVGLIVPTGLATDYGMSAFFNELRERRCLRLFLDFENRAKIFPEVDGRFRFAVCVLTNAGALARPRYAFFLHCEDDLDRDDRALSIGEAKIAAINPNTRTVPVVRSKSDLKILVDVHRRVPVLDPDGSGRERSWDLEYRRFFDMTTDSDKFRPWGAVRRRATLRPDGFLESERGLFARVYEGRMIDLFDHRAASCVEAETNYRRPASSLAFTETDRQNPEQLAFPRYAVDGDVLERRLRGWGHQWFVGFMDIGSATNRRTMIASVLPKCAAGNKVPLLLPRGGAKAAALLLANLASFVFDYSLRQHIGNITLNWFMLRQCPVLPPAAYENSRVGEQRLDEWIQNRVLQLTYTSTDLAGWAHELGHHGAPFVWDSAGRRQLRIELDALFFALYGLAEDEIVHAMDTFHIIRRAEEAHHGEYRLRNEIVEKWREIQPQVRCSW